jgi:hypothetical protein
MTEPRFDSFTEIGALHLAETIAIYWQAKGYPAPNFRLVPFIARSRNGIVDGAPQREIHGSTFALRSDMLNGVPRK